MIDWLSKKKTQYLTDSFQLTTVVKAYFQFLNKMNTHKHNNP